MRLPCKIDDFAGVTLQVEQFLDRFGLPKLRLGFVQFSSIEQLLPDSRGWRLEHVVDMLEVGTIRIEMPHVDVASIGARSHHVDPFVHPATKTEQVGLGFARELAGEGNALHVLRRRDSGQTDRRGCHVDKRDQSS